MDIERLKQLAGILTEEQRRSVLHKSRVVNMGGWTTTSTLCNRNTTLSNEMNIADKDEDVTCKFCLSMMKRLSKK